MDYLEWATCFIHFATQVKIHITTESRNLQVEKQDIAISVIVYLGIILYNVIKYLKCYKRIFILSLKF